MELFKNDQMLDHLGRRRSASLCARPALAALPCAAGTVDRSFAAPALERRGTVADAGKNRILGSGAGQPARALGIFPLVFITGREAVIPATLRSQ